MHILLHLLVVLGVFSLKIRTSAQFKQQTNSDGNAIQQPVFYNV